MIENFSDFYLKKIRGKLVLLEVERKKGLRLFSLLSFITLASSIKLFWTYRNPVFNQFLIIAVVVLLVLIYKLSFHTYRKKYKEKILAVLFGEYLKDCFFRPDGHLSEAEYVSTLIYQSAFNKFSGEDYAAGVFQGFNLKMSELQVAYQSGSGKNKSTKSVFRGLMIIYYMPHRLKTITVIKPDYSAKILGTWLGGIFNKMEKRTSLESVRLENPEFEREFKIEADDQIDVRKFLTPYMQEQMLKLRARIKMPFALSVQPGQVSFAFSTLTDFFDPPIITSCIEAQTAKDIDSFFKFVRDVKLELEKA